ncbi:MAG TPA: glycosyltransferase family 9 protein, partial [Methylobacter sp.]
KARTFRALLLLAQGDFSQGWKEYEYRLQSPDSRIEEFTQALWLNNAPLTAKSIILCAEQGIGDTIQFIRYVGKVRELNPKAIYLKVQAQLKTLLESLPGIAQVFDNDDLLPEADYYCPLASLPFAFKTDLSTIPGQIPYVSASSELRSNWKTELAHYQAPRIGLVWSGNRKFSNDAARSIPLQEFGTLLENNHVHFFSLQKEVRQDDQAYLSSQGNIIDLAPNLDDFSDTAAVIANLDLVITVDTAVAHLAGAMGKPVWILLPFAADFRWLIDRTDSPWYPTAKLFRQTEIGNWRHVLEDVVASLDAVFRLNDVTLQRERNA